MMTKLGMGQRIKLGTILLAGMLTLGTAILLFNVRKARACEPPCTLTCTIDPPSQTICDGGSATFTCTNSGGFPDYTYSWTGPNGFSANTAAITIYPAHAADAGAYRCIVTDINDCAAQVDGTLNIVGVQSVAVDKPIICPGITAIIRAFSASGSFPPGSPTWNIEYPPNTTCRSCFIGTAGSMSATFKPARDFSGVVTITATCGSSSSGTTVTVVPAESNCYSIEASAKVEQLIKPVKDALLNIPILNEISVHNIRASQQICDCCLHG